VGEGISDFARDKCLAVVTGKFTLEMQNPSEDEELHARRKSSDMNSVSEEFFVATYPSNLSVKIVG